MWSPYVVLKNLEIVISVCLHYMQITVQSKMCPHQTHPVYIATSERQKARQRNLVVVLSTPGRWTQATRRSRAEALRVDCAESQVGLHYLYIHPGQCLRA